MLLRQLSDWPRAVEARGVLRSAKRSPLGHFIMLEIENDGGRQVKLLEVPSEIFEKVLAVLLAHAGESLDDIAQREIGD
jgi:hypothetical protein